MSDVIISVENVSKVYQIGVIGARTFREDLNRWWAQRRGLPDPSLKIGKEHKAIGQTIRALDGVSLEVKRGEAVGIIGKNGAGKSTLLKVLSRVTAPTSGEAKIRGRVASLLEVGTGFHPELTGRENVFLNGAILGMSRAEITQKLDEIIYFSGVEQYIDTPVKRYSSGMRVRLAFSVAAHLDPEVLIVDEVLAVGDITFQRKSFEKMEQAEKSGRTVLVVSHNMMLINRLCSRGILLDAGKVTMEGETLDVVNGYMALNMAGAGSRVWDESDLPGNDIVRLKSVRAHAGDGKVTESFDIRKPIHIEFEYQALKNGVALHPTMLLLDSLGNVAFMSGGTHAPDWVDRPRKAGWYKSVCVIPGNLLAEGMFIIRARIDTMYTDKKSETHLEVKEALSFNVYDPLEGDSARGKHVGGYPGIVRPILKWQTELVSTP